MIQSLYEVIIVMVAYKDYTKIPDDELFFMSGKFYLLLLEVEAPTANSKPSNSGAASGNSNINDSMCSDKRDDSRSTDKE